MSVRFIKSLASIAIAVSAKGGYSFVTMAGAHLKESVRTSNAALARDYVGFANSHRNRVGAPLAPGTRTSHSIAALVRVEPFLPVAMAATLNAGMFILLSRRKIHT